MPQPFRLIFAAAAMALAALACSLPAAGQSDADLSDAAIDALLLKGQPGRPETGERARLFAELDPARWAELRALVRKGVLASESDRPAVMAEIVDFNAGLQDSVAARLRTAPPPELDALLRMTRDLMKELAVRAPALCAGYTWREYSDTFKIQQAAPESSVRIDIEIYRAALKARAAPASYPPYDDAMVEELKDALRSKGWTEDDVAQLFAEEKPRTGTDAALCALTVRYYEALIDLPDKLRGGVAAVEFSGDHGLGQ